MKKPRVFVTQPHLPPLEEFIPYLEKIWERKVLTNGGPFHEQLEAALCDYLGVEHLCLFSNGTIALISALQALDIHGEAITTPYSFVATTHALAWNRITPVFADVDPHTLNLDPDKVERAITEHTRAIVPVHCYGTPCDVDAFQKIADKHKLRLIYDAAHAFGVRYRDQGLLHFGDLSVLSFHATKVFNTFEGGAIVCPDAATKRHIDHLKNFGFTDEVTVETTGINGKMNEVCAAMGLVQLGHMAAIQEKRGKIDAFYRERLREIDGVRLLDTPAGTESNYAYFPILIQENYPLTRDQLYEKLRADEIYARRYFYPLISEFPIYHGLPSARAANLPVATLAAQQVLCLPIFPDLGLEQAGRIVSLIAQP
ncbi:DegT/DnrJ/EryC1/StrS family aminotransferase [Herbaspirillum sp. LeCh32-8]|uniref:DegT/DnrJ/EryC1/StrS family aminotransferase n=1 Tax=Herbaspirillum sp. LeCh32-8 TaxID=2821356 RepID=UPI001AEB6E21|nr:DegT/DnrJ/EryC1/StrS family aminotransferase [Herbaspirillum sp. LeCh32-8]MBP0600729.1 DegT/DnrJ/EryC1/StrS family aminotransferase [Herbaspirillum sp. LeCh32-8]